MSFIFLIKNSIFPLIILGILCLAILLDWKYYFKHRKINNRKLWHGNFSEEFILAGLGFSGFILMGNIGFHGGFYYCYIADVCHSLGWLFAIIYILGSLSLPIIGKLTKIPYTKDTCKYWGISRIGMFIIFYILGLVYFWFYYGPSPAHAWPPKYSIFTRF